VTLRRLEVLQWFGLLVAAPTWFAQLILGWGLAEAQCGPGGQHWNISNELWQSLLMVWGLGICLVAESAAVTVFRATSSAEEDTAPPEGRMHFFSTAALAANLIFAMIILLTGVASIVHSGCTQS
jgi:hypothetical protein